MKFVAPNLPSSGENEKTTGRATDQAVENTPEMGSEKTVDNAVEKTEKAVNAFGSSTSEAKRNIAVPVFNRPSVKPATSSDSSHNINIPGKDTPGKDDSAKPRVAPVFNSAQTSSKGNGRSTNSTDNNAVNIPANNTADSTVAPVNNSANTPANNTADTADSNTSRVDSNTSNANKSTSVEQPFDIANLQAQAQSTSDHFLDLIYGGDNDEESEQLESKSAASAHQAKKHEVETSDDFSDRALDMIFGNDEEDTLSETTEETGSKTRSKGSNNSSNNSSSSHFNIHSSNVVDTANNRGNVGDNKYREDVDGEGGDNEDIHERNGRIGFDGADDDGGATGGTYTDDADFLLSADDNPDNVVEDDEDEREDKSEDEGHSADESTLDTGNGSAAATAKPGNTTKHGYTAVPRTQVDERITPPPALNDFNSMDFDEFFEEEEYKPFTNMDKSGNPLSEGVSTSPTESGNPSESAAAKPGNTTPSGKNVTASNKSATPSGRNESASSKNESTSDKLLEKVKSLPLEPVPLNPNTQKREDEFDEYELAMREARAARHAERAAKGIKNVATLDSIGGKFGLTPVMEVEVSDDGVVVNAATTKAAREMAMILLGRGANALADADNSQADNSPQANSAQSGTSNTTKESALINPANILAGKSAEIMKRDGSKAVVTESDSAFSGAGKIITFEEDPKKKMSPQEASAAMMGAKAVHADGIRKKRSSYIVRAKRENGRMNGLEMDFFRNLQNSTSSALADDELLGKLRAPLNMEETSVLARVRKAVASNAIAGKDLLDANKKIAVTETDVEILRYLAMFRYATAKQVARLRSIKEDSARQRLMKLRRQGLVLSKRVYATDDIWFVSKAGMLLSGKGIKHVTNANITYSMFNHQFVVNTVAAFLHAGSINALKLDDFPAKNRRDFKGREVFGEELVSEVEIQSSLSSIRRAEKSEAFREQVLSNIKRSFLLWKEDGMSGPSPEMVEGNEYMWAIFPPFTLDVAYHVPDLVVRRARDEKGRPQSIAVEIELANKSEEAYRRTLEGYKHDRMIYGQVVWVCQSRAQARKLTDAAASLGISDRLTVVPIMTETGAYKGSNLWEI